MILILDNEARQDAKRVKEYAEAHPFNIESVKQRIADDTIPPPGDNPEFVGHVKPFFRFVYTVEEAMPGRMFRSLSVSHSTKQRPSPVEVGVIMDLLGFQYRLSEKDKHHISEEGFESMNDPNDPDKMRYAVCIREEII